VRSDVTVSQGGERDAAEVEPFDASPALGFLLDAEICGQVRPIELRIPDDELPGNALPGTGNALPGNALPGTGRIGVSFVRKNLLKL
jgi:hypothetical protein